MSLHIDLLRQQFQPYRFEDAECPEFIWISWRYQIPQQVLRRMKDYLVKQCHHGGHFRTSRESDAV